MSIQALETAIKIAGSQTALAKLLKVRQGHISNWLNRNKRVPANHVINIEKAVGVSRHDLRPDIYPPE